MSIAIDYHRLMFRGITVEQVRTALVSLIFASSFYVKMEPAPSDLLFLFALVFCLHGGLRLSVAIMPLFLMLLIYNLSCLFSYTLIPYDRLDAKSFLMGLAYTSLSGVFFAAYVADDPVRRYHQIIRAYWVGATIGAALGLVSYFKIQPLYAIFPAAGGRAVGGFNDPNVFSTWLVLPMVTMLHAFMLGHLRIRPIPVISFLMISASLFLAFSRGAWINALAASAMTMCFTYMLSPSRELRGRIAFSAILSIAFLAILLVFLLSIPTTRDLFLDRFTLVKNYDAGETGRFGNQINSIPKLFQLPLGFGPLQFRAIYGLDPHNTFLNAFASGGWIGGVTFLSLVIANIYVGIRTVFTRTPFQLFAIPVFACLLTVTFQGVQIDTENWRHLYWMTGITWGFFTASLVYRNHRPVTEVSSGGI